MNQQDLNELKEQLLQDKKRATEMMRSYQSESDFLEGTVGELNSFDQQHPGDFATELDEREKDIALHEHMKEELREIERALRKIEQGTYGLCERTGEPIPIERLKAMPTARYIIDEETK
ncbi:TraR/DksA C4-type zinc finger protein [Bacillaceae bacterium W0354]